MNVAFTGHRDYDEQRYDLALERRLLELCRDCASRGEHITFLSGMAVGFDMSAAELVCELRDNEGLSNVSLHAVVPYAMQAEFYSELDLTRYQSLINRANKVTVLEEDYSSRVFFRRNDFLVEHADLLIAYFDGVNKGGTAYTIRKARKSQLPMENIYEQQQLSLF